MPDLSELGPVDYIPARLQWPRSASCWPPTLGVIHDMEAPEGPLTAENCAHFFQKPNSTGSAHLCADTNSVVRCVQDDHMAAGAKGFPYRGRTINDWALHIELCGYARQSRAEWLDASSVATLRRAAPQVARWCMTYDLPAFRLTDTQIRNGARGLCGHGDVSRALGVSGGHTDPGAFFPWDVFLPMILSWMEDEVWTDAERAKLLQGADASIAMEKRWDQTAREKLDDLWTQVMDQDHPQPGKAGTLGGRVVAIAAATVPEDS